MKSVLTSPAWKLGWVARLIRKSTLVLRPTICGRVRSLPSSLPSFLFMGQRSINECYGSISYLSRLPSNDCFPFFPCIKVLQMKSRNSQIRKKHPVSVLRNHHILPFVFFLIPKHDKDRQQREHTKTSHPLWSHTVLRRRRQVSDSNNQGDNCAC